MEFSSAQAQHFINFLHSFGILSEKQQLLLLEDFSRSSNKKFIFLLADFFKKLTPSDSYDMAVRLFSIWEKSKNYQNNVNNTNNNMQGANNALIKIAKTIKEENINEGSSFIHSNNNEEKGEYLEENLTFSKKRKEIYNNNNNDAYMKNQKDSSPFGKKPEGFKKSIRVFKFQNIFNSFFRRNNFKTLKLSFQAIKNFIWEPKREKSNKKLKNYMQDLDLYKSELSNFEYLTSRNKCKTPLNEEFSYEGPRPLNVTPYRSKESIIVEESSQKTQRTQRERPSLSSQKKRSNSTIHEKLYKEAGLKQVNALYLESVKKKNEMDGCTFRPNIIKNEKFNKNNTSRPAFEKLYLEGEQRKLILQEKQKSELDIQLKECTFCPQTLKSLLSSSKTQKNSDNNKENKSQKITLDKKRSLSSHDKISLGILEIKDTNVVKNSSNINFRGSQTSKNNAAQIHKENNAKYIL